MVRSVNLHLWPQSPWLRTTPPRCEPSVLPTVAVDNTRKRILDEVTGIRI